ncbi:MAG TPA: serine hydrolase domain-containing protein [Mycobacteriales bacterium]|nr:serine hydrolase domain-containing protein [Mycobacteriales bacterium]
MTLDQEHWAGRLAALAEKHGVPGANLAIMSGDEVVCASYGVLNVRTGVETTTDSLFQIGSITKVWTATLIMQLVDEGLLDLDQPIITYLPEFKVADESVSKQVTARHLLSHTSGIDGDFFLDTGRGDDCIEKYVAACADLKQTHPLGATMSYCNSGFSILGRLVEVLRGQPFDQVLRERLFVPLGITSACTIADHAILHRAAVGHVGADEPQVVPVWALPRSTVPAGAINAAAADVLKFAKLHLDGGVAADGTRVLSVESVRAMLEPQVEVPDPYVLGTHWGLGWILMEWDGHRLCGHDGGTLGQGAMLRICPDAGVAACLTGNGGRLRDLYFDLFKEIFGEVADVQMQPQLEPPATPPQLDLHRYAGRFVREGLELSIEAKEDRLAVTTIATGTLAAAMQGQQQPPFEAFPVKEDVFAIQRPGNESWEALVFYRLEDGTEYVHTGGRANPRVA